MNKKVLAIVVFSLAIGCVTGSFARQHKDAGTGALMAEDYIEIQQLYARYNYAIDSGDGEAYAATFVPDGIFVGTVNKVTGHDALVSNINRLRESNAKTGTRHRHWNSNLLINGTPDGANGSVYLLTVDVGARPPVIAAAMVYDDQLVKTAQGWRFKSRITKADRLPASTGK